MPVARVPCGLFGVSASWPVPFLLASIWGSRFPVLLFLLLGPDLSLSLSALLAPASRPWGYSWLAPVSVLATFVARFVPRHLLVAYLLVSLRFCTVLFQSLFPTFLVGSSSSAFPWRPSSLFWFVQGVG